MSSSLSYVPLKAVLKYMDFGKRISIAKHIPSVRVCLRKTPHFFHEILIDKPNDNMYIIRINDTYQYNLEKEPEDSLILVKLAQKGDLVKIGKTREVDLEKLLDRFICAFFEKNGAVIKRLIVKAGEHRAAFPIASEHIKIEHFHLKLFINSNFRTQIFKKIEQVPIDILDVQSYTNNERFFRKLKTVSKVKEIIIRNLDLPTGSLFASLDCSNYQIYRINEMNGVLRTFRDHCKNLRNAQFAGSRYSAYIRNFRGCFSVLLSRIVPHIPCATRKTFLLGEQRDCISLSSNLEHLEVNIFVDRDMMRPHVAQVMVKGSATNTEDEFIASGIAKISLEPPVSSFFSNYRN